MYFIKDVVIEFLEEFVLDILGHIVLKLLGLGWVLLLDAMNIIYHCWLGDLVCQHIKTIWILTHILNLIKTRLLPLSIVWYITIVTTVLMLWVAIAVSYHIVKVFEEALHV